MSARTDALWAKQNVHPGARESMFAAAAEHLGQQRVLYVGSYVDVAASFVFDDVTYFDMDARAEKFFGDRDGVEAIIAANRDDAEHARFDFFRGDYTRPEDRPDGSFDLLVSLYAGFISEHCTDLLRSGGHLLTNNSHGDASMASLDPRYDLAAVIVTRGDRHVLSTNDLDTYLEPKKGDPPTVESLHASQRGVAYTKSPFIYVFQKR